MVKESSANNKRTPAVRAVVLKALKIGLNPKLAAELAGISKPTLYRWRDDDPEFDTACKASFAEGVADMVTRLLNLAEQGNVAAIIFWLKTRTAEFRESALVAADDEQDDEVDTKYL